MDSIYLSSKDIQKLMGCKATKAAAFRKKCDEYVKQKMPNAILPGRGKCYLKAFCKLTGTTKEEVWAVLRGGAEVAQ